MQNWTIVILNSCFSFVAIFVIAKMLGKKQVAQLTVVDYVVGITIGNIAGQWCTDYRSPWYLYFIGMAIFLTFTLFINFLERKIPFKKLLKGKQLELVTDGKINYKNLKKSKLDINDMLGLLRAKGYFDIDYISYVFLENNGEISVLAKDQYAQPTKQDLGVKIQPQIEPAKYLIIDGKINKTVLTVLKKDINWLYKKCNIINKKELKSIILAEYTDSQKIALHYKINK